MRYVVAMTGANGSPGRGSTLHPSFFTSIATIAEFCFLIAILRARIAGFLRRCSLVGGTSAAITSSTSRWPSDTAQSTTPQPESLVAPTSAPAWISSATTSGCPFMAADTKGGVSSTARASIFPPLSMSSLAMSRDPRKAAQCSGEKHSGSGCMQTFAAHAVIRNLTASV